MALWLKPRLRYKNFILCLVCGLLILSSHNTIAQPIAVIVHSNNPTDDVSNAELARIYNGRKRNWADGQRIFLVNHPANTKIRERFYKMVLGVPATETFFIPETPIPLDSITINSDSIISTLISQTPNAIGYVQFNTPLLNKKDIKALKINGVSPGQANYPLE